MLLPLLSIVVLCFIGHSTGTCPSLRVTEACKCFNATGQPFRYRLLCNGQSTPLTIAEAAELAREENVAGNFTEFNFNGPPDTGALRSGTFAGFTALESIIIQFGQLSYIEPHTFSTLPNLTTLKLSSSRLTWLSGEPFIGLSSLTILVLDGSAIKHLREDMEQFFSTISGEISLTGIPLICDCHLRWLYEFSTTHTTIMDAHCDGDMERPLSNSTTFNQCPNLCELGYHACHVNATCTEVAVNNIIQTACSCNANLTGDGIDCELIPCECLGKNMVCEEPTARQVCVCEDGYTLTSSGLSCYQTVSTIFLNLTKECSGDSPTSSVAECAESALMAVRQGLTLPGDIYQTVVLLSSSVERLTANTTHPPSLDTAQALVEVASQLLNESSQALWLNSTQIDDDSSSGVVELFAAMNELGNLLLTNTNITNITTDNIAMVLVRPECDSEDSVPSFGGHNISSDLLGKPPPSGSSSNLSLPMSLFEDVFANGTVGSCSSVGVVALVYGGIGPLLTFNEEELLASIGCSEEDTQDSEEFCPWYGDLPPDCPTEWRVNSVIISATVVNSSEVISSQLSSPVTISLAHQDLSLSSPICAFIDETQPLQSNDSWLTDNCERDEEASTETVTVCNCYHLTSFALVMSPSSSPPPENQPLHIATKVGLSLSILCLLVTVLLLFGLKLQNKAYTLHHVHRQLAIALGLAQLVFLVGVDRSTVPSPDQLCSVWAVLLHYLLLATFLWQLCEGVHLYLFIKKPLHMHSFENFQFIYFFVAWGVPLLIVGPTVGLKFCDYGSRNYCWITPDSGTLWAFHGPVIAVLLINAVVLVYVVSVILKLTQRKEEDACLFITLIHASVILVPILGVTWALGFFVVAGGVYATVVEWLFFVFTTLQGVGIFMAHCLINREIRSSFFKAIGCRTIANQQLTIVDAGRQLARAAGPSQHLRKISNQSSGSLSVGGFTTPTTVSRRESEVENAYTLTLATIKEKEPYTIPEEDVIGSLDN